MYTSTYIHIYIHTYRHTYIHIHMHMSLHICTPFLHTYLHIYIVAGSEVPPRQEGHRFPYVEYAAAPTSVLIQDPKPCTTLAVVHVQ